MIHPILISDAATASPAAELPFADVEPSAPPLEDPQAQSDAVITAAKINASNFFIFSPPISIAYEKIHFYIRLHFFRSKVEIDRK